MPCWKNSPLLRTKKLATGFTSNSKQHLGTTNLVEFNMKIPYSFTNDDERLRWERRSMAIVSSIDSSLIQDDNKLESYGIEKEHNDRDDRSTESNIQKGFKIPQLEMLKLSVNFTEYNSRFYIYWRIQIALTL